MEISRDMVLSMLQGISNMPNYTTAHLILQPLLREPLGGWSTYQKRLLTICEVVHQASHNLHASSSTLNFDTTLVIGALMEERNIDAVYALIFLATRDYEEDGLLDEVLKAHPLEDWITSIVQEASSESRVRLTVDLLFLSTQREDRLMKFFELITSHLDPECPSALLLTPEQREAHLRSVS